MKKFDNELASLQARLREMSDQVRTMVRLAAEGVQDRQRDIHDQVAAIEKQLDKMQMDIDRDAVRMLTVYSPVAKDLRYLLVVTHVTAQIERMGDQVVNICEALRLMSSDPAQRPTLDRVQQISRLTCQMVDDAIDAYFNQDADKAEATRQHDDMIDALNDQVVKELLTDEVLREVLSGATDIADAVAQILISRNFERIADQAVNICKEVVYMVRGDDVRHRPK